jgi:hypothetical protein
MIAAIASHARAILTVDRDDALGEKHWWTFND